MKTAQELADEALEKMDDVLNDMSVSKTTYRDALEIIRADLGLRIDAVNEELKDDE